MEENAAEKTNEPQAPTGIKGWLIAIAILILASAMTCLGYMAAAYSFAMQFSGSQASQALAFTLGTDLTGPVATSLYASAVFLVMFIAAAALFFMKKRWAVPILMLLFGSFAIFAAWNASLWASYGGLAGGTPPDPTPSIAFWMVVNAIAIIYLWRSKRVSRTFSWRIAVEGPSAQDDPSELPPTAKGFVVANWVLVAMWYLTLPGWGAVVMEMLKSWDYNVRSGDLVNFTGMAVVALYPVVVVLGSRASWRQLKTGRPWRGLALTNSPLLPIFTIIAIVFLSR